MVATVASWIIEVVSGDKIYEFLLIDGLSTDSVDPFENPNNSLGVPPVAAKGDADPFSHTVRPGIPHITWRNCTPFKGLFSSQPSQTTPTTT